MFKKRIAFEVIGGQNYFKKSFGNVYVMKEEKEPGVVDVKGKKYYFLGVDLNLAHERSAGKAAAGAIIGGVLTGGVGAVAGAAIGGRKRDASTAYLDFANYDTKQRFRVQVKKAKNQTTEFASFPVANLQIEE